MSGKPKVLQINVSPYGDTRSGETHMQVDYIDGADKLSKNTNHPNNCIETYDPPILLLLIDSSLNSDCGWGSVWVIY